MKAKVKGLVRCVLGTLINDDEGKIVFYHDVCKTMSACATPTAVDFFTRQIEAARAQGWEPVACVPIDKKTYQVQFDDGFRGVYECREELVKIGVLPTVNLAVSLIGEPGYLTREEIKELQGVGFGFQSHTWSHAWLPECDDEKLRHELIDSKRYLEDLLQVEVPQICFPRGLFSRRVYDAALECGYKELVSCIPGNVQDRFLPHVLHRNIVQNVEAKEFPYVLRGAMKTFMNRYARRQFS